MKLLKKHALHESELCPECLKYNLPALIGSGQTDMGGIFPGTSEQWEYSAAKANLLHPALCSEPESAACSQNRADAVYTLLAQDMSQEQKAVLGYANMLLWSMGLGHWELFLLVDDAGSTAPDSEADTGNGMTLASIRAVPGNYVAGLRYLPAILNFPPDKIRDVFVHEMAHLYFMGACHAVEFGFGQSLPEEIFSAHYLHFDLGMELGINSITKAMAKHLPLPDFKPLK